MELSGKIISSNEDDDLVTESVNQFDEELKYKIALASKIKKKYETMSSRLNTNKFLHNWEYYITSTVERLDFGLLVERRIEARRLALSVIYSRESHVSQVKYCSKKCQEKLQLSSIRLGEKPVLDNEEFWLAAICGTAYGKHVLSSEQFFSDAVRYPMNYASHKPESGDLLINEDGEVMNILPVTEELKRGGKSWECTGYCKKVNPDILIELTRLFQDLVDCTYWDAYQLLDNIDRYSASSCDPRKRVQPIGCSVQLLLCAFKFLNSNLLSYHYPYLQSIKRMVYELKYLYGCIHACEVALRNADIDELRRIKRTTKKSVIPCVNEGEIASLVEDEIVEKFKRGIEEYERISSDPPSNPCISCQGFFNERQLDLVDKHIEKFEETGLELTMWKKLMDSYDSGKLEGCHMCKFCISKFRRNQMPSTSGLNNMLVKPFSDEIKNLNIYE
ncbi:hypothetical protein QAD02_002586 [Eretmocerus hayati]|uniref:Uncharacterized protein n=1 Tax=Eretmocerus hayati TaxID=131215 RepID=A0ACC2NJR9_9HYME|nr:hypothetical protein QAD02_002586 [Eretmocerus hayati]